MKEIKTKKIQGSEQSQCFTSCCLSNYRPDGRLIAVNDRYLAISWKEAGLIKLVPSNEPQNLLNYNSGFKLEDSNILDMEFSPFDNNVLCFSNENNYIYITKLLEDEDKINIIASPYKGHQQKIIVKDEVIPHSLNNFVNFIIHGLFFNQKKYMINTYKRYIRFKIINYKIFILTLVIRPPSKIREYWMVV